MIKPTIGRVVWFWPDPSMPTLSGIESAAQPFTASICYVHDDDTISVGGFRHDGRTFVATMIPLYHGEGPRPLVPHAEWMPYQKGQAAKTEALEKKLEGG